MFNVINKKFMMLINNLLIILLIAVAIISVPIFKDKYLYVVVMFSVLSLPYFIATWRTRDFHDVDKISGTIALSLFLLNIILYGSNKYGYTVFLFANIITSIFCDVFNVLLYNITFKVSCAKTEFRRVDAAIEYSIFMHSLVITIFSIVLVKSLSVNMTNLWVLLLVLLVLNVINKLITFCIAKNSIE